mgnify:CR=1 FL=1
MKGVQNSEIKRNDPYVSTVFILMIQDGEICFYESFFFVQKNIETFF